MAMNQVGFPWWKRPGIFLPWRTHLRKTCWPHLLLDNKRFPVLRISFSVFRFFLWVSLHSKLFFLDLDPTTFNTLFAFASHAVSNQARGMRAAETQGVGMDVVRPKKTKKERARRVRRRVLKRSWSKRSWSKRILPNVRHLLGILATLTFLGSTTLMTWTFRKKLCPKSPNPTVVTTATLWWLTMVRSSGLKSKHFLECVYCFYVTSEFAWGLLTFDSCPQPSSRSKRIYIDK